MQLGSEAFMAMLETPELLVKSLLADSSRCDQNGQAFRKLEQLLEDGKDIKVEQVMKACAKSIAHLNEVNTQLLLLLVIYTSGNNFSSDVGRILIRLGRGQDALQAMFKKKMQGG